MRALVQRVREASVRVDGRTVGAIGPGLLVLLSVGAGDDPATAERLARRTAALRCFADAAGAMNRSLLETGGAALVVSQFTLHGDTVKGNRPSFTRAAPPALAESLYRAYVGALSASGVPTQEGVFRAHMEVSLVNDGPVTLWLTAGEDAAP